MTNTSWVIVLAEDPCHQQFVRGYLYRLGFSRRQLDFRSLPNGRGSGEQWVRQQYANAVQDYRTRSAKAQTALVAIIDADTADVNRRLRQFKEALEQAGVHARKDGEAIVHLIPKRNIETWILHLSGEDVDEERDYSNRDVDDLIPAAAATFFQWTAQPPANCLPSLRAAIQELIRLK